jgi:hypothetical protein
MHSAARVDLRQACARDEVAAFVGYGASRPFLADVLQASLLQILRAHQNAKFAIGLEVEKERL